MSITARLPTDGLVKPRDASTQCPASVHPTLDHASAKRVYMVGQQRYFVREHAFSLLDRQLPSSLGGVRLFAIEQYPRYPSGPQVLRQRVHDQHVIRAVYEYLHSRVKERM